MENIYLGNLTWEITNEMSHTEILVIFGATPKKNCLANRDGFLWIDSWARDPAARIKLIIHISSRLQVEGLVGLLGCPTNRNKNVDSHSPLKRTFGPLKSRPKRPKKETSFVWTNHPFSGANWELLVSGRVTTLRPKNPWKNGRCWSLEMWVKQPNKSLELQRLEKNSSGFPGSSVSKLVANSNLKPRREAIATTDGRQMRLQSIDVS